MSVYAGGWRFVGAEVITHYHDSCLVLGGLEHEIDCVNGTLAEIVMVLMHCYTQICSGLIAQIPILCL
jgi:hypothetical protein